MDVLRPLSEGYGVRYPLLLSITRLSVSEHSLLAVNADDASLLTRPSGVEEKLAHGSYVCACSVSAKDVSVDAGLDTRIGDGGFFVSPLEGSSAAMEGTMVACFDGAPASLRNAV